MNFKVHISNPLNWKNLQTKLSVKVLWFDDVFRENLDITRKLVKVNMVRATRRILRLKGLECINISIPNTPGEDCYRFFDALDQEIYNSSSSITINLQIFSSSKDKLCCDKPI